MFFIGLRRSQTALSASDVVRRGKILNVTLKYLKKKLIEIVDQGQLRTDLVRFSSDTVINCCRWAGSV